MCYYFKFIIFPCDCKCGEGFYFECGYDCVAFFDCFDRNESFFLCLFFNYRSLLRSFVCCFSLWFFRRLFFDDFFLCRSFFRRDFFFRSFFLCCFRESFCFCFNRSFFDYRKVFLLDDFDICCFVRLISYDFDFNISTELKEAEELHRRDFFVVLDGNRLRVGCFRNEADSVDADINRSFRLDFFACKLEADVHSCEVVFDWLFFIAKIFVELVAGFGILVGVFFKEVYHKV